MSIIYLNKANIDSVIETSVDVPSKVWSINGIKKFLNTNDVFVIRSLLKLYKLQTEAEKTEGHTGELNGVGFNAYDAPILTSIAKQIIQNYFISDRQLIVVKDKIKKYAKQITKIANGELVV